MVLADRSRWGTVLAGSLVFSCHGMAVCGDLAENVGYSFRSCAACAFKGGMVLLGGASLSMSGMPPRAHSAAD